MEHFAYMTKKMQFRSLLVLIGLFVFAGCANNEQESPNITIETTTPEPLPLSEDIPPSWPDQELLLNCTIEWEGEQRGLFTQYDPARNHWHSKRILSYFSQFDKVNILSDDRHWIVATFDGIGANSWPLYSYSLNHKLGEIPIETDDYIHFIFVRIHFSNLQPDEYLIEQLCNECPSSYWWIDVNKCHEGDCQFQSLGLGYPSTRIIWSWSPDFRYLFLSEYSEENQARSLVLTDHDGLDLYSFSDITLAPFWLDSTIFGFWSRPSEQEGSILYYGSINDGEIHSLFTESDMLQLLPISSTVLTIDTHPALNTKIGENQFIFSFSTSYDEPEPKDVYNFIVNYDQLQGEFDVLWESFGQHSQYLSPDRTKIYISTDDYIPWETYDGDWEVVDLLYGDVSTTNWLPLNLDRYNDLSYDTEWRVNFEPVRQELNQIIGSKQMILANKSGFQKAVEYPDGVSDCSGGWIFK